VHPRPILNFAYNLGVTLEQDAAWMRIAIEEAEAARAEGEVPVGAVVVSGEEMVARAHNRTINDCDPTAHAEILVLRAAAARVANHRLSGCTLYVTIEPCAMCAGAVVQARVERLVYGCDDPKAGAVRSLYQVADDPRLNHRAEVTAGVLAEECAEQIRSFFQHKRQGSA
jgi:tRNA(adenine34) deaminase